MARYSSIVWTQTRMGENNLGFPVRFSLTSVRIYDDHEFQPITVLYSAASDICMGYPRSNPDIASCKETFLSNLSKPAKSYKSFAWKHFGHLMKEIPGRGREIKKELTVSRVCRIVIQVWKSYKHDPAFK